MLIFNWTHFKFNNIPLKIVLIGFITENTQSAHAYPYQSLTLKRKKKKNPNNVLFIIGALLSFTKLKNTNSANWRRDLVILPPTSKTPKLKTITSPSLIRITENPLASARWRVPTFKWPFLLRFSPLSSPLKLGLYSILLLPLPVCFPLLLLQLPCACGALSPVLLCRRSSRNDVPEALWSPVPSVQKWPSLLVHRRSLAPKRLSVFGPILRSIIFRSILLSIIRRHFLKNLCWSVLGVFFHLGFCYYLFIFVLWIRLYCHMVSLRNGVTFFFSFSFLLCAEDCVSFSSYFKRNCLFFFFPSEMNLLML